MKKNLLFVFILFLVAAMLFAGCASAPAASEAASSAPAYDEGVSENGDYPQASASAAASSYAPEPEKDAGTGENSNAGYSSSIVVPDTSRKIILTQYIETKTKNFDDDLEKLNTALKTAGGYLQESNISGTKPKTYEDEPRTASFTFRVPRQNAENFVKTALTAGEVVSNRSSGQDITKEYMDTEARVKTLRTRLDRLEKLLSEATKMADIVTLETEISNVTYEIESLEGQKKGWDNLVDYVTVQMSINEVNVLKPTVSEPKEGSLDFGQQLSNGFFSVLNGVVDFFKTLLLIIVAGSPIIIPVGAIVLIIIFSIRAGKKKGMNKTDQL
jgi:hypothetical protein